MRLVLSRLQPSDFDASIPSQFAAFVHDGGHLAMLGANSAANVARAKTALLGDYAADASNVWIKVSDADAGDRFVAASNWKVYPTYVKGEVDARAREMAALRAEDVGWFEGEREKEDAAVLTREFYEIRYRFTREAHVLLHILFTDPAYQGKGAGKMMLNWGNALADHLMLPCWVEGSKLGHRLYLSGGYEDVYEPYHKTESLPLPLNYHMMKRPLKVTKIEGGTVEKR